MGLTVVVVDDTPDYRLMVRSLLASVSETMSIVGEAADGELGLALVRRKRPDIVISDLMMPRLDGFELARRMREELPQTTIIIIISSHTEDSYRALASASGADAFVCKQVLFGSLVPAIRDAIARRASCGDSSPTTSTSSASAGSPT